MINPLDVVMNQLNSDGVTVEVKRQRPDGRLENTSTKQMATLGTQSRLAHTANLLNNLSNEEKMVWALEMKDQANVLYREQNFSEAMNTYVEALTASSFGSNNSIDNTDSLVVPVLCNLAACCIQLQEWSKSIQFSDQALNLRPNCPKAHFRKAVASLKVGNYEDALLCILTCQSNVEPVSVIEPSHTAEQLDCVASEYSSEEPKGNSIPNMELSEADKKKLPNLLYQARIGIKQNKERLQKQKEGLMKAFNTTKPVDMKKTETIDSNSSSINDDSLQNDKSKELMSFFELFLFFFEFIYENLKELWKFISQILSTTKKND